MSFNTKKIRESIKLVSEVNEVVGTFEVWIEDCPVNPIKVKVLRLYPQERYMGIANYSIQNPEQMGLALECYGFLNPISLSKSDFREKRSFRRKKDVSNSKREGKNKAFNYDN